MRTIQISEFGGPEVLKLVAVEKPSPGAGQILLKTISAGLNRADILQRQGKYPVPDGTTSVPGLEVCGEVMESHTPDFNAGDVVVALLAGGGYQDFVVAEAGLCFLVPEHMKNNLMAAGGLAEALFTIWMNVIEMAGLQPGETFLMHGGTSGVGTLAIPFLKAWGAKVITTSRGVEKAAFCKNLGADMAIDTTTKDFTQEVEAVDVILDMVGGDTYAQNLKVLAQEGRIVSIATAAGARVALNLADVMAKRAHLTGSFLRSRSLADKLKIASNINDKALPLLAAHAIVPVIDRVFPLEEVAEAHRYMESGQHKGKIILSF